jgi:DNA-binding CsgD family transcriptional regulator
MNMQPGLERALALGERHAPEPGPARRSAVDVLTTREREIAGHIANGLSNHAIAEQLVITEGTVEVHVKHILGKLGLRSRIPVVTWFLAQRTDLQANERTCEVRARSRHAAPGVITDSIRPCDLIKQRHRRWLQPSGAGWMQIQVSGVPWNVARASRRKPATSA